ncbi:MAG: ATP-binding protein [Candidatus Saliniplasma sp.]
MDGICLTEVENEIQEGKKALTEEDLEEIAEIERGDTVSTEEESQEEESIQDGFVGVTFGDVGTTTLQCNVCNPVDKGEYIELHHPTADRVLGQIEKVERKTDLSVDKAIELSNGERIDIDETIIATINIIGYRDERGLLKLPGNPFRAGEKIYLAKEDLIRDVIGLKEDENGAFIGKLRGHDIEVKLDINSIAQKHLSVLAKTGSGKSYTTGVIIEEFMKHDVTNIILDPHGEYSSMAKAGKVDSSNEFGVEAKGYGDKLTEFTPMPEINKGAKPLRFTFSNMEPTKILEMSELDKRKSNIKKLEGVISRLEVSKGNYSIDDMIRLFKQNEEDDVNTIIRGLKTLKGKNVFAKKGTRMDDIVQEGKTSIINLKGTPPDLQNFVVNKLSTALFELRKRNKIPPLMLFAEEAHNFCPQRGKTESSEIFHTIASEGRKFGLGLAIITQRPAKVDKNVLSQCNTQVILKVTNPNDLKAIESSIEGVTKQMKEEIQRLPIGEAIVTGGGLSEPLFVGIRPRETQDGGQSIRVV